jgi:alpha-glucosidase
MHFSCKVTPDGLALSIGAHQGRYAPWWTQIRVEVFGWAPKQNKVLIKNHSAHETMPVAMGNLPQGVFVNLTDDGKGTELELQ